ncbi:hypothetical protein CTRI78_v011547 [Colletotrichum trifolii]|uniref:Uncharacterized protein n=1 Tax=Colletotrichum trifolii TaxID=5466 RepID=A0A4R8Q9B1_COLTR|nr:hypothetical protein CTRI78_v011547 [Colletotrichum trifolii]
MYSTPEEIRSAVGAYRTHIKEHNRRILEVYVPAVAAVQFEEDDLEDDDESTYNITRLDSLSA